MKLTDDSKAIVVIDKRNGDNNYLTYVNTFLIVDKNFVSDNITELEIKIEIDKQPFLKVTTCTIDEETNELLYHDRNIYSFEILEAYNWKDIMEALK